MKTTVSRIGPLLAGILLALSSAGSAHAGGCGEASCNSAQGAYISHFSSPNCTGTESYYLPYDSFGYDCRSYDGGGECGTIQHTVTNYSYRDSSGSCHNAWPNGNPLSNFVTVYRPRFCGEASCNAAQSAYISHFTGSNCTGTESYYLPYSSFGYQCRPHDGDGECGTIQRTVTNRSYRDSSGNCYNAWPNGNPLSNFVTVYRTAWSPPPPPPPLPMPPVACGYPLGMTSGTAPFGTSFSAGCSFDPDGSITGFLWSFGDGGTSSSPYPYHFYFWPGFYSVYLSVVDNDGKSDTTYVGTIYAY
ncbi:MAG TPA: PKD domain-containing protein [Thermoanaerobaculia bacterium]|nr:PKD domain-containing protein [Thermoanaerobaculia bacterium]